jgi:large subunit ribosomal protein L4
MRRAALREAVAAKLGAGQLSVVDALGVNDGKTKTLATRLKGLGIAVVPTLLVVSEVPEALARASRNLVWLSLQTPGHVSVYELLRSERVLFEKAALQALEAALRDGESRGRATAEVAPAPPETKKKPRSRS